MNGYVIYQGRRFRVVSSIPADDRMVERLRLRPFKGADVIAPSACCKPWKRSKGRRIARGTTPHRGRPIIIEVDTSLERIEVRQKGRRQRLACTFGGLYDLLARQLVLNAKLDRAFAKRTRRKS